MIETSMGETQDMFTSPIKYMSSKPYYGYQKDYKTTNAKWLDAS